MNITLICILLTKVNPINNMLGTLLSNSLLLIGGITLCFTTSWRLSMLAFTTVGPIIHITQVYASWSRGLNRQIYGSNIIYSAVLNFINYCITTIIIIFFTILLLYHHYRYYIVIIVIIFLLQL